MYLNLCESCYLKTNRILNHVKFNNKTFNKNYHSDKVFGYKGKVKTNYVGRFQEIITFISLKLKTNQDFHFKYRMKFYKIDARKVIFID